MGRIGATEIIIIAVLGLVIVNAMKHSPWATATVFATLPIAVLIGFYVRYWRPGKIMEGSVIGLILILAAVVAGGAIDSSPTIRNLMDWDGVPLAGFVIIYALIAAVVGLARRSDGPPVGVNPRHSILVLPFDNLRGDPAVEWLRDGSVSMLGLNLSQWNDLSVVDHERLHDLLARDAGIRTPAYSEPDGTVAPSSISPPTEGPA